MDDKRVFEPAPQALAREVGTELVVLNLQADTYYGLNAVGARIWTLLGQHMPVGDILAVLAAEFDAPEPVLKADLNALVDALVENELVIAAG